VLLVSEAYVETLDDLVRFYGNDDQVQLPFNFFLAQVPTLDAAAFRRIVAEIEGSVGADRWPSLVLSNHDIDRACDRFVAASRDGGGGERDRVARLLAMMLLTLRGSPFIYYGEEIGMRTEDPDRLEEVRDPVGRTFWPRYKGRDGERRPMCWERSHGAGFTSGTPWLALSSDAADRNVAGQQACAGSLLTFYRTLLAQRRSSRALSHGRYRALESHPDVFAFERWTDAETAVVLLNMSSQHVDADLRHGRTGCRYRVALGSHRPSDESIALDSLRLSAFESLLAYPAAP
jgi:alpha-glucosidase